MATVENGIYNILAGEKKSNVIVTKLISDAFTMCILLEWRSSVVIKAALQF